MRENKYVLTCCEVPVKSRGLVWRVPGCRQGWHTPKQHTNYTYVGYYLYMNTLVSLIVSCMFNDVSTHIGWCMVVVGNTS